MTEPAPIYQTIQPASTDGLEDLFEADVVLGSTKDYQVGPTDVLPVNEAAKRLGLSVKTIKDRLRKGTLKGYKVHEKFGDKWMVCLSTEYQVVPGSTEKQTPYQVGPTDSIVGLLSLLQTKDRELQAATFRNGYLEAQLAEREQQLKLLPDLQGKANEAEALRQQLESIELELASYKSSWWANFKKWFLGQ